MSDHNEMPPSAPLFLENSQEIPILFVLSISKCIQRNCALSGDYSKVSGKEEFLVCTSSSEIGSAGIFT